LDREKSIADVRGFRFPKYTDIPDMGLYLEQVLGLVNQTLAPIQSEPLTGAMVSNYIKHKAIPAPVKKKYHREHIAYLLATCALKQVFTVQHIARLFEIQRETYTLDVAYNFFCTEYENALMGAFSFTGEALPCIETIRTPQTILVRSMVLTAANRVYVEKVFL